MSKMREEFEEFAKSKSLDVSKNCFGEYRNWLTIGFFEIWQSAIASVVVELPVTCCRTHVFEIPWTHEVGMEHDEYFEVEDIHKCLDAAGIKYK